MVLSQLPLRKVGKHLGWWTERLGLGKALSISHETSQRLYQYYKPEIEELSVIIGRDLDIWAQEEGAGKRTEYVRFGHATCDSLRPSVQARR
jgi:hypothetical protein